MGISNERNSRTWSAPHSSDMHGRVSSPDMFWCISFWEKKLQLGKTDEVQEQQILDFILQDTYLLYTDIWYIRFRL